MSGGCVGNPDEWATGKGEDLDRQSELERLYCEHADLLRELDISGEILRPVFGQGPMNARVILVGEAPGAQETEQGAPFVGKAGRQLDELLQGAGIERKHVFVTNAVKFRPIKPGTKANRAPTRKEVLFSWPLLMQEIALIQPCLLVTLGNTPLFALTNDAALRVGDCHGRVLEDQKIRGGVSVPIFALYHPASIIYNQALLTVCERDIALLRQLLPAYDKGS